METAALPSREREALLRVVTASAGANDLDGVLELAATEARAAIGAASLSVSRFTKDNKRCKVMINVGELAATEVKFPDDEIYEVADFPSLMEMALTGKPYFNSIDDPETDPATLALLTRLGKSSDLGVAIEIEGRRWGVIWATTLAGQDDFRAEDVRFLEAVAAQIGSTISRAEMFSQVSQLAYQDPLTGLANRRAMEERLERAAARFANDETAVSILLCDVDRLKATNDAHGHAAGDDALRQVAAALVTSAADYPGSFVGRIGGDEFCVLLETRVEDFVEGEHPRIADLGAAAQRLLAENGGTGASASLSCGVATASRQTFTPSQLLDAADAAQYLAKRRGGSRVCTAAQVAEGSDSSLVPIPAEKAGERYWETVAEVTRTLDGELRDAPTLDRLEVVAATFTAAGNLARWAIAFAADGTTYLRDVALGDNRERRRTGARVAPGWADYEFYELDDFPLTSEIVAAGSGSFIARVDDPEGDPSEQALLVRDGFHGVVGAAAGDPTGVYLVELVSDLPDAPLEEIEAALRLAVRAAISPHGHRRDARPLARRYSRALDLALALPKRLANVMDVDAICQAAVEELQRSFGCSVAQMFSVSDDRFVLRAELPPNQTEPGWTQKIDAGLIGRCLTEGRAVVSEDVAREPGYRASKATDSIRSELAAPISIAGGVWGVVNLEDQALGAFDNDDAQMLEAVAAVLGGAINAIGLYRQLDRAYLETAEALSAALETKDSVTADHSRAIADNAAEVGSRLGLEAESLRMLRYAAAFHDIGKLAIPREILNKPGPLTAEERIEMDQHTLIGERILEPIEFLQPIRPIVRHAHERWDGSGYPDGLAGEAIPLGARIVFACDTYDAMTTDRPYKPAMSNAEAIRQLEAGAGSQFDPRVVEVLLEVLG